MGLESASFIDDLNTANPLTTDDISVGDDHIRLIKTVLKATLPNAGVAFGLGEANTWTAAQIITITTSGTGLRLVSTDTGTGSGPNLDLHRDSSSPAINDTIGGIVFSAEDLGSNKTTYSRILAFIDDPATIDEDGHLDIRTTRAATDAIRMRWANGVQIYDASGPPVGADKGFGTLNIATADGLYFDGTQFGLGIGNTWTAAQTISLTADATALNLISSDVGAGTGPTIILRRNSASPDVNDNIGAIKFIGEDSADNQETYVSLDTRILDETSTEEDGVLLLSTVVEGALAVRVRFAAGIQIGAPTDGDKGAGTLNAASGVYDDGVRLGASGWVLIESLTASASTSIDFETGIDSTYDMYAIVLTGVRPTNDATILYCRIGTGATPTYQSGSTDYENGTTILLPGTPTIGHVVTDAAQMEMAGANASARCGFETTESIQGIIYFAKPSNAALHTLFNGVLSYQRTSDDPCWCISACKYSAITAITAVRFLFSAGEIAEGDFDLFGIKKA